MAAIKNQPAPKPSSAPAPVPGKEAEEDFNKFMTNYSPPDASAVQSSNAPVEDFDQFNNPPEQEQSPTEQALDYLPAVGGLVGGIGGSLAGGIGAIPGAALGGVAGESLRRAIEVNLLGKSLESPGTELGNIALAGAEEGAAQAIGGMVMKGAGKLAGKALYYADDALKGVKNFFSEAKETLEKPILEFIANRASKLSPKESGDVVKELFKKNITEKYGPFLKAYGELDDFGSMLPLKEETKKTLSMQLRGWANKELGGDVAKAVNTFANQLDSAQTGKQFRSVIKQIGDAKEHAFSNNMPERGYILKLLKEKADNFLEGETMKLAGKINSGKAAPEEIAIINQILQSKGIVEPDPAKYAKAIARDYLKDIKNLDKDYAGFRHFLSDVAEQTKIKGIEKMGPKAFIEDLDAVSSEKLIERMFDPKNSQALIKMFKENPEAASEVANAKIKNLLVRSSPDGNLNLKSLQKLVNGLPEDVKKVLFPKDEVEVMNKIVNDPNHLRLQAIEKKIENQTMGYINLVSKIISEKTPGAVTAPIKQAVGKPLASAGMQSAKGMGQMMMTGNKKPGEY